MARDRIPRQVTALLRDCQTILESVRFAKGQPATWGLWDQEVLDRVTAEVAAQEAYGRKQTVGDVR